MLHNYFRATIYNYVALSIKNLPFAVIRKEEKKGSNGLWTGDQLILVIIYLFFLNLNQKLLNRKFHFQILSCVAVVGVLSAVGNPITTRNIDFHVSL